MKPAVDGSDWVLGLGTGPHWRAVTAVRAAEAAGQLKAAAAWGSRQRWPAAAGLDLPGAFKDVLSAPPAVRDSLLLYPAMDFWLSVAGAFAAGERPAEEAALHFAYFPCFAAAAAVLSGKTRTMTALLTRQARFHATGSDAFLEFPAACADKPARVRISGGVLSGDCGGVPGAARRLPALAEGMWVEAADPLVLSPVVMHGLASFGPGEEERFTRVLAGAMARLKAVDAPLFDEMTGFLRLIVPLDNPKGYGSVSSSYRNLRGALCLSHSDDSLLQEETLIHEFCHQKVNLLSAADPLVRPGQGGQVVYSPLRPDARRLTGLLLGAHAFVNVNRYLLKVLRREEFPAEVVGQVRANIARRLYHVDDMLRTVSMYALLTPAGERFQARLWREHALTVHDALDIPKALMDEGRRRWREHREQRALAETGLHELATPEKGVAPEPAAPAKGAGSARAAAPKRGRR